MLTSVLNLPLEIHCASNLETIPVGQSSPSFGRGLYNEVETALSSFQRLAQRAKIMYIKIFHGNTV